MVLPVRQGKCSSACSTRRLSGNDHSGVDLLLLCLLHILSESSSFASNCILLSIWKLLATDAASMLALEAGADFVKTSTGKINIGATPEAAYAMLSAVRDYSKKSKKSIGFKAAGGISNPSDALVYYIMYKKLLGKEEINNQNFRIGASRLTSQLFKILTD